MNEKIEENIGNSLKNQQILLWFPFILSIKLKSLKWNVVKSKSPSVKRKALTFPSIWYVRDGIQWTTPKCGGIDCVYAMKLLFLASQYKEQRRSLDKVRNLVRSSIRFKNFLLITPTRRFPPSHAPFFWPSCQMCFWQDSNSIQPEPVTSETLPIFSGNVLFDTKTIHEKTYRSIRFSVVVHPSNPIYY